MIVTDIYSGLGNQMFQYAYGRALQEKYKDKLVLNYYPLIRNKTIRSYSLNHFKLNDSVIIPDLKTMSRLDFISKIKRRVLVLNNTDKLHGEKTFYRLAAQGMFANHDVYNYSPNEKCNQKDKYVIGFWQSEKYFRNISEEIKKEFEIITPPSEENKKLLEEIQKENAVCVHIRRGDYLTTPGLDICNEKYYKDGMKYIADRVVDPVFYIFSYSSKDIKWIKENYKFDYQVKYVDLNNPDYEELRLMIACRHFVISNSTFSWWAQYLSKSDNKIVIAPSKWNAEGKQQDKDIYMDNWTVIDIND